MIKTIWRCTVLAASAAALSAIAACGETSAPPPSAPPPSPPPADQAPPPALLGGPPAPEPSAREFTPMAPIANPEDMTPEERARVYGYRDHPRVHHRYVWGAVGRRHHHRAGHGEGGAAVRRPSVQSVQPTVVNPAATRAPATAAPAVLTAGAGPQPASASTAVTPAPQAAGQSSSRTTAFAVIALLALIGLAIAAAVSAGRRTADERRRRFRGMVGTTPLSDDHGSPAAP